MAIFEADTLPSSINRGRRETRAADELIGMCRGILADGHVNSSEARFLADWVERNRDVQNDPLVTALYRRIDDALTDGVIDETEEADLLAALHSYIGGEVRLPEISSTSTWLPLDEPAPPIVFTGQVFVVTGTFAFGARKLVTEEITKRGGQMGADVRTTTNLVVVGEVASRDWVHSSYGRKIMAAADFRGKGHPVAIVSEAHWRAHL